MGRITSNVGLVTGIPIKDTVDQLLAVEARPRDLLVNRNKSIQSEQVAVKDLMARLLSLEFSAKKLGDTSTYDQARSTSSNAQSLASTVTGNPPLGDHQFTVVQTAQSHQLLSSAFANTDAPLDAGSLAFRFGGFVDPNIDLGLLNGGEGINRGRIRVTDRSGTSAEIDLRFARTLEDVLKAISDDPSINVTAVADGDRIRLIDNTGQTTSNLKVQEIGQGTTAASLGLAGIDTTSDQAVGEDMVRLFEGLSLQLLNGGNGVRFDDALADLSITFRDGSAPLEIDFNRLRTAEELPPEELHTLGEVLQRLNEADPARLKAEISPDGDRIVLTDLTADQGGTFAVTGINRSRALDDLGLGVEAAGAVATGKRVLGGLGTTLLTDLGGTIGLGQLGLLLLTDRSGQQATVDLASAETLQDVLNTINAAGVNITARINDARNGIQLEDTSGATASNLIVADGDAQTQTASKLGLLVNTAETKANSGDLKRRIISENTTLASLNGGAGVAKGSFTVFSTLGPGVTISITDKQKTIGDVIDEINRLGLKIEARINDAGDGIALVDTGGGTGKIKVLKGLSSTAADLHLLGESSKIDIEGKQTEVLNGSTTARVTLDGEESLTDLVKKINALNAGVTATIVNDGSSANPFHLVLTSQRSGEVGELLVDASDSGFRFAENVAAQDARLLSGTINSASGGILATSSTNDFENVLDGVKLTAVAPSSTPVVISITNTDSDVVAAVQAIVDTYNGLRSKIVEYTRYDEISNTFGTLYGDFGVRRVDAELSVLIRSQIAGVGSVQALDGLGIRLKEDGTLAFDADRLRTRFAEDPSAVRDFFAKKDRGFVDRLKTIIEQAAGSDRSLLNSQNLALERKIALNQERIDFLNSRLDKSRERWLLKFYNLEQAIGKIKNNLDAIGQIQAIPPLGSTR